MTEVGSVGDTVTQLQEVISRALSRARFAGVNALSEADYCNQLAAAVLEALQIERVGEGWFYRADPERGWFYSSTPISEWVETRPVPVFVFGVLSGEEQKP